MNRGCAQLAHARRSQSCRTWEPCLRPGTPTDPWCTRSVVGTAFAQSTHPGAVSTGSHCQASTAYPRPTALRIPATGVPRRSWCEPVEAHPPRKLQHWICGRANPTHPLLPEVPPGTIYRSRSFIAETTPIFGPNPCILIRGLGEGYSTSGGIESKSGGPLDRTCCRSWALFSCTTIRVGPTEAYPVSWAFS